jgi:hypothetical protein
MQRKKAEASKAPAPRKRQPKRPAPKNPAQLAKPRTHRDTLAGTGMDQDPVG